MCAAFLVAVVGATFAYFTAANPGDPKVTDATGSAATAEMAKISLTASTLEASKNTIWPGTKNSVGVSVTTSKTGGTAEDNYTVHYTVSGKVQASEEFTKGEVTWNLYKTTSSVAKPIDCKTVTNSDNKYSQTCTLDEGLSNSVASGTLSATEESPVSYKDTIDTAGGTNYYYLVVSYQDQPLVDQSEDANGTKTITYEISSITVDSTEVSS